VKGSALREERGGGKEQNGTEKPAMKVESSSLRRTRDKKWSLETRVESPVTQRKHEPHRTSSSPGYFGIDDGR
jgi:hypothetical protein